LYNQLGTFVMAHVGRLGRIVDAVGQVTDQSHVQTPGDHGLDAEGPVQHTHVGVHAHDEEVGDAFVVEETVDLPAAVGDEVLVGDLDGRVLARPGAEADDLVGVGAVLPGVKGEGGIGVGPGHR